MEDLGIDDDNTNMNIEKQGDCELDSCASRLSPTVESFGISEKLPKEFHGKQKLYVDFQKTLLYAVSS